jgi:hypothetical protein
MASAGFGPANLGTKGQHATSRPLKPLCRNISGTKLKIHSLLDRHLLMNSYPVQSFYVSLNQISGNKYCNELRPHSQYIGI